MFIYRTSRCLSVLLSIFFLSLSLIILRQWESDHFYVYSIQRNLCFSQYFSIVSFIHFLSLCPLLTFPFFLSFPSYIWLEGCTLSYMHVYFYFFYILHIALKFQAKIPLHFLQNLFNSVFMPENPLSEHSSSAIPSAAARSVFWRLKSIWVSSHKRKKLRDASGKRGASRINMRPDL